MWGRHQPVILRGGTRGLNVSVVGNRGIEGWIVLSYRKRRETGQAPGATALKTKTTGRKGRVRSSGDERLNIGGISTTPHSRDRVCIRLPCVHAGNGTITLLVKLGGDTSLVKRRSLVGRMDIDRMVVRNLRGAFGESRILLDR